MRKRKTAIEYEALGQARGFIWLGPPVPTVVANTGWQCSYGHNWDAPYDRIKQGAGCRYCARQKVTQHRRLKPSDYDALGQRLGLQWLGPEVRSVTNKTHWRCKHGHDWMAPYQQVRLKQSCPRCNVQIAGLQRRRKESDYETLARQRGFIWLGPVVASTSEKTQWQCEQGHPWLAAYSKIQYGTGCPICSVKHMKYKLRLQATDYEFLGRLRGFAWLGPEVANTMLKTGWKCSQGHSWMATYSTIKQGSGCRWCAINAAAERDRLKAEHYYAVGKVQGFTWLGPEVSNNRTKTSWQCRYGHCWESTYACIKQGTGCPKCAMSARRKDRQAKPAYYELLASRRGFTWLGQEVRNKHIETGWQCREGHSWEASYNAIEQGENCPLCQRKLHGKRVDTTDFYELWTKESGSVSINTAKEAG